MLFLKFNVTIQRYRNWALMITAGLSGPANDSIISHNLPVYIQINTTDSGDALVTFIFLENTSRLLNTA